MREISLHIMDIAENGIAAGADLLSICVNEQQSTDWLSVEIADNGKGIPETMIDRVVDPFFTSRTTRRVGLGLSLLKAASERCGGRFELISKPGQGAKVKASFRYSHIDRAPMGDMAETLGVLIIGHPGIEFAYTHQIEDAVFSFDTRELKKADPGITLTQPAVYKQLLQAIRDGLKSLAQKEGGAGTRK